MTFFSALPCPLGTSIQPHLSLSKYSGIVWKPKILFNLLLSQTSSLWSHAILQDPVQISESLLRKASPLQPVRFAFLLIMCLYYSAGISILTLIIIHLEPGHRWAYPLGMSVPFPWLSLSPKPKGEVEQRPLGTRAWKQCKSCPLYCWVVGLAGAGWWCGELLRWERPAYCPQALTTACWMMGWSRVGGVCTHHCTFTDWCLFELDITYSNNKMTDHLKHSS